MSMVEEMRMIGMWFDSIWHFIASSASIATIIGGIAVAVAILEPKQLDAITDLRKWAIVAAVVAFSYTSIAGKFYHDGLAVKQAQWNEALANETAKGEQDRADAESTVRNESPDGMRIDPRNRDNWGSEPQGRAKGPVRWLESHRLFGKQRQPADH